MAKNAKSKFYVVWKGAKPGVYASWDACKQQVMGYPDARYKSFATKEEAEDALRAGPPSRHTGSRQKSVSSPGNASASRIIRNSISVDAACSGNPGKMEYRGVLTETGEEIFHQGPFPDGTNNIGEFLAIVHGLAWLKARGDGQTPVYSDSKIARGWVSAGYARTKLERTRANSTLFELIRRAEEWLKAHRYTNPILKWETEAWGEIPADFGRK